MAERVSAEHVSEIAEKGEDLYSGLEANLARDLRGARTALREVQAERVREKGELRRELAEERDYAESRSESDNESFAVLCEIMCLHFDDPKVSAGACPVEMPDMLRTVRDWFAATRTAHKLAIEANVWLQDQLAEQAEEIVEANRLRVKAKDVLICANASVRRRNEKIDRLTAERDALVEALETIAQKDQRAMYERCPYCDEPGTCDVTKICATVPDGPLGKIANKALAGAKAD